MTETFSAERPPEENLKREIGIRSLTLAILNITIGAGIFVLPAIVAENMGATAVLAYLFCGLLIFLIALCFAEAGSRVTTSGGPYAYIENAFGPFTGFLANNLFWVGSCVTSDAALANVLADTLKFFFPVLDAGIFRTGFLVLVFGGLALLNIRGVKHGIRFIEFASVGKIILLLIIVISGIRFVSPENLKWASLPTIDNLGSCALILFYAFLGIETAVTNSGEIKNSKRTVPLGIFFGIGSVLILYIAIQTVTQGILGSNLALQKEAPLAEASRIIFGKTGVALLVIATIISVLGSLGGEILAIPRILYAGGRDGLLPKVFSNVHPKFFTPYVAVIFYASLGFLIAVAGGFKQLAVISSASTLLIYLGVVLASVKLRKKFSSDTEKTFTIPGGIIVPLIASAIIIWILSHLAKQEIISITVFLILLTIIFFFVKLLKKKSSF